MKNILITGLPGVGKTTLLKRLVLIFKEFNPAGFFTSEIMENGLRTGYQVENIMGDIKLFAHVSLKSRYSAGKYKIDIKGFDDFLDKTFNDEKKIGFYVIDEIGKMECESKKFCKLIIELLNSERPVLAVIPEKGSGLIGDIRRRDDVRIFELTQSNSELKLKELLMILRDFLLE